jgi:hypothetical protein
MKRKNEGPITEEMIRKHLPSHGKEEAKDEKIDSPEEIKQRK